MEKFASIVVVLACFVSCGGGSSGAKPDGGIGVGTIDTCSQGCTALGVCAVDAGATSVGSVVGACQVICSGSPFQGCSNASAINASVRTCIANATCTGASNYVLDCEGAAPTCAQGGSGGSSGAGTGGRSGGGTGGTGGTGVGATGTCAALLACCSGMAASPNKTNCLMLEMYYQGLVGQGAGTQAQADMACGVFLQLEQLGMLCR